MRVVEMTILLDAFLVLISVAATGATEWSDRDVYRDDPRQIVTNNYVVRSEQNVIQAYWKNTMRAAWRYEPLKDFNNFEDEYYGMTYVYSLFAFANRLIVEGYDSSNETVYHLVDLKSGKLIRELEASGYDRPTCGVRATPFRFAICTFSSNDVGYVNPMQVFDVKDGRRLSIIWDDTERVGCNFEYAGTDHLDFALLRGIMVWATSCKIVNEDWTLPPNVVVGAYHQVTGEVLWRKVYKNNEVPISVGVDAGLVTIDGNHYKSLTGEPIDLPSTEVKYWWQ
jgi:hypothetical protein